MKIHLLCYFSYYVVISYTILLSLNCCYCPVVSKNIKLDKVANFLFFLCSYFCQIHYHRSSQNLLVEECLKIGTDFANVENDAERIALWNMISNFKTILSNCLFIINIRMVLQCSFIFRLQNAWNLKCSCKLLLFPWPK